MTDVSKESNEQNPSEDNSSKKNQTDSSRIPNGDSNNESLKANLPKTADLNDSGPEAKNTETTESSSSHSEKTVNADFNSQVPDSVPLKKKSRLSAIVIGVLFIVVIGLTLAIGVGGYWLYPKWQQQTQSVASLQSDLRSRSDELSQLKQSLSELNQQLNTQNDTALAVVETLSLSVEEVTQRLNTHNDRLLSLSNTSRDDWLLAEAHYLVRLAGQRILIDQNVQSALGLMEAADEILRDLSLPDLFPVRQALARDLAAIRLAAEVDREGIYLRLQGIAETVTLLPTYQLPDALRASSLATENTDLNSTETKPEADVTVWGRTVNWFGRMGDSLSQYFQIRHHDEPVAPLLPPSATEYLRQNLRFSIEQAQLAMLREELQIYKAALMNANTLVETYFPDSSSATALTEELSYLSQLNIVRALPSINNSQKQLQAYIEKLHKLGGAETAVESATEGVTQ